MEENPLSSTKSIALLNDENDDNSGNSQFVVKSLFDYSKNKQFEEEKNLKPHQSTPFFDTSNLFVK